MTTPVRRAPIAALWGTVLCVVFAECTFVAFEALRIKAVRDATPAQDHSLRIDVVGPVSQPRPPVAIIWRVRNQSGSSTSFSLLADGQHTCMATVAANRTRRIDCSTSYWPRRVEISPVNSAVSSWTLEYLEVATHHGSSFGLVRGFILPATSKSYQAPGIVSVLAVWLTATGLFLWPPFAVPFRSVRYLYRFAAATSATLLSIAAIAPVVSPYRILLSGGTFVGWSSVLVAPRLVWLSVTLWRRLPGSVRRFPRAVLVTSFTGGWRVACLPALVLFVVGVAYGQRVVGGADTYGYVSQADLWLKGDLTVEQPFVEDLPWPRAGWTFTTLGYRPRSEQDSTLVPVYPPGLPLMMAAGKALLGHDGLFLVVPLCAAAFVLATGGVGRRLGSGVSPAVAAWLVASSPVVLMHTISPMSDVPVAAAWTLAIYFLLGPPSSANALRAGLASGVAIVIRPNLVPLAGMLGLHYLFQLRVGRLRRRVIIQMLLFGAGAGSGALFVAGLYQHLYGSPLSSGYGELGELFDPRRVATNLRNYLTWFAEVHTPIALLGLVALAAPLRWLWPQVRDRKFGTTASV